MTPARRPVARAADARTPLAELLHRIDARTPETPSADAVGTGFPSIDQLLGGGLRRGDLVVLGGDVSSGKSALALAIALRAAATHAVVFASAEMAPERVLERVLAIEGRVRVDELRRGALAEEVRARAGAAAVRLRDAMPRVERLTHRGVEDVEGFAGGSRRARPALVIVDSLQALAIGARKTAEEEAAAVRELKALALGADVAILATSQLAGLGERADRRPRLDDFGALGAVPHHADVVLALYREAMYDSARDVQGATELLVRKNRHGATGYADLYFYAEWMRFEDMLDPDR